MMVTNKTRLISADDLIERVGIGRVTAGALVIAAAQAADVTLDEVEHHLQAGTVAGIETAAFFSVLGTESYDVHTVCAIALSMAGALDDEAAVGEWSYPSPRTLEIHPHEAAKAVVGVLISEGVIPLETQASDWFDELVLTLQTVERALKRSSRRSMIEPSISW